MNNPSIRKGTNMRSKDTRQQFILDQLNGTNEISVNELSARLLVSAVTIRKDLEELENAKKLVRVHGGARSFHSYADMVVSDSASSLNKRIVAKKAASLVNDGEIVFLGSGTTCIEIAKALRETHRKLTIVSNNLTILTELASESGFTLLGTGGQLNYLDTFSVFHGDFVIQFLEKVLVQKAFLTADGVSLKNGYTTHNRNEYHLYETIQGISEKMIFAVEGKKFNKNSILRLADMDSIQTIVTDSSIPDEYRAFYHDTGKNLYIGTEL